ncbi:MAG TPA: AsmA family protein [Terriglobales bacterium]|nr:AsmA family protein [Terriglobales bacterium]
MALRRRSTIALAVVTLILLGVFLPPFVNVNRYRGRITDSIQRGLGRPVTVGSVSLRLFPQPGFDLGNVTVGEDPAFGVEPMLHADEVRASLRLTSLWRGRLEIAKLSLRYPSLNLVRAADGRWNVEALLQNASRIPTAPTTKARPEARPRFPYIEAEGGRINFKIGAEKKVYALADSDFALWLASETELRTRLAARMVRTDSYLSDTGTLKMSGRFQRAWDLRDTPLEISATLKGAQLGQLTKFVDGNDRGWRGEVDADLRLGGTPAAMTFQTEAEVNDFRRYDIGSVEKVKLAARCAGKMSAPTEQLSGVTCQLPLGDGVVTVRGDLAGIMEHRSYDLSVTADKVAAQALVSLARHAKKDIPADLSAQGTVNLAMTFRKQGDGTPEWSGGGTAQQVVLRSAVLEPELVLGDLNFALQQPEVAAQRIRTRRSEFRPPVSAETRFVLVPFNVPLGGSTPTTVGAWFGLEQYAVTVQGESLLERLAQVARASGFRLPDTDADGQAKLDITITGKWAGFASPKPTGTVQLRSVTARMQGVASPLKITSAALNLGPDSVTISNANASFADVRTAITGWLRLPRQCETVESCPVEFDLHADRVNTDELNRLLNPKVAKRPWYAILGNKPAPSIFSKIQATGRIAADHVLISSMVAHRVVAKAQLSSGVLALNEVNSELWGGRHTGQWRADYSQEKPAYSGTGTVYSAAMQQLGTLMRDNWASGSVNATYKVSAAGFTSNELLDSAKAQVTFEWRNGTLRHVSLNGSKAPLTFRNFSGNVEFASGQLSIAPESKMTTSSGIYQVSGTASPSRQMNLTFRNGPHAVSVTGTLEQPQVTPAPVTEAEVSLKQ